MQLKDLTPKATPKKINKITESRFGFSVDYDRLTVSKAKALHKTIEENLNKIRRSAGFHTAHQNPRYMELLMVREGISKWLDGRRSLTEGEVGQAEVILAAKNMVDNMQDMIEKVSKMQNEQLQNLLDSARDQLGSEQADAYKATVAPALQTLMDTLQQTRESLDSAARGLAGEQVAQPMAIGGRTNSPNGAVAASDIDDSDSFDALDAAAGGPETLGREMR